MYDFDEKDFWVIFFIVVECLFVFLGFEVGVCL